MGNTDLSSGSRSSVSWTEPSVYPADGAPPQEDAPAEVEAQEADAPNGPHRTEEQQLLRYTWQASLLSGTGLAAWFSGYHHISGMGMGCCIAFGCVAVVFAAL